MAGADQILSEAVVARLNAPIAEARGIPAAAYTSEAFFADEQARLFPNCWMGVAFDTDLPEPGDALPVSVCGQPIVLVRDARRQVQAFHNVCRHRATLVVTEPRRGLTQLQCPYHAWTYGLDGALLATPFWDGTARARRCPVDAAGAGLVPVACAAWNHVVFVNLAGNAGAFADYVAPFEAEYGHLDLAATGLGHRRAWEFRANWKLVMDNWEVYHHVWVHQGVFDRMSEEVDLASGEPYTESLAEGNVMILRPKSQRPPRVMSNLPQLPPLPRREEAGASRPPMPAGAANAVLPNTTLSLVRTTYAPAIYRPVAPGVTRVEMAWYFAPEAAEGPEFEAGREAQLDVWLGRTREFGDRAGIRSQDHACMEWQQLARASPVADDVRFSATWERDVHYFQRWLVARLAGPPG